ncbi:hypothetical protein TRIUR3_34392 [Triticum urartu]|uniref:Uncharacterized protein n=1 Tax=Triticum urartu TaxID=4572 RepID=M8A5P5_TRIUA|nr:hypothetical protein TRIUR3_34392 [Triticum urartu]
MERTGGPGHEKMDPVSLGGDRGAGGSLKQRAMVGAGRDDAEGHGSSRSLATLGREAGCGGQLAGGGDEAVKANDAVVTWCLVQPACWSMPKGSKGPTWSKESGGVAIWWSGTTRRLWIPTGDDVLR